MKKHPMQSLIQKQARLLSTTIIIVLFSLSLWQLASVGWIQGKAIVAQQLLNHSWQQTMNHSGDTGSGNQNLHKPWPWADTWPVAKLLVPQHDIEQIVLSGDSGSSLAFGPGMSLSGATPGTPGITMISGHRDTHFRFLKDLSVNQVIYLQTNTETLQYQVEKLQIVDSKDFRLQNNRDSRSLILVTCYPFDAVSPGGSLRYLVQARQIF